MTSMLVSTRWQGRQRLRRATLWRVVKPFHTKMLTVAGAGANRIHMAPIRFRLRVNFGVAIYLNNGREAAMRRLRRRQRLQRQHSAPASAGITIARQRMLSVTSEVDVRSIRALTRLARPSMLRVPSVLVLIVLMGLY